MYIRRSREPSTAVGCPAIVFHFCMIVFHLSPRREAQKLITSSSVKISFRAAASSMSLKPIAACMCNRHLWEHTRRNACGQHTFVRLAKLGIHVVNYLERVVRLCAQSMRERSEQEDYLWKLENNQDNCPCDFDVLSLYSWRTTYGHGDSPVQCKTCFFRHRYVHRCCWYFHDDLCGLRRCSGFNGVFKKVLVLGQRLSYFTWRLCRQQG